MADDLLQNNGKKFLDMMERLAERRIKKEDPLDYRQDDDEDDEDDDEYLDDDDYEDEEEEVCCVYITWSWVSDLQPP